MWAKMFRRKPPVPAAREAAPPSPLVLAKLGHDLRPVYDDVVHAPLPEAMQQVIAQLPTAPALHAIAGGPPAHEQETTSPLSRETDLLPDEKPIV